jgi:integrase
MQLDAKFSDTVSILLASYRKKDPSFVTRSKFWMNVLGDLTWKDITCDHIQHGLALYCAKGKERTIMGEGQKHILINTGEPLAPATINRMRIQISSLVKMAKAQYLLPATYVSPAKATVRQQEDNERVIEMSREEVEALINSARLARWKKLPALIAVACTSGLRAGNLKAITWRNINFEERTITVLTSKNGKPYTTSVSKLALAELQYIKRDIHGPDDLVFGKIDWTKGFENAVKRAGLDHKLTCFHLCRHIAASQLASAGYGEMTIMKALGQRSASMARRYTHLASRDIANAVTDAWDK